MLIVFAWILLVMKCTRIGLDIRAVAQNRAMAKALRKVFPGHHRVG